jgi:hypothetical protein
MTISTHGRLVQHNLLVAALGAGFGRQFQPVQRALPGQGLPSILLPPPSLPRGVNLPDQRRKKRINSQLVMVVQVLVSQGQGIDALGNQIRDRMLDELGIALVLNQK